MVAIFMIRDQKDLGPLTDRYSGQAYDMQEALDIELSWLSNHAA